MNTQAAKVLSIDAIEPPDFSAPEIQRGWSRLTEHLRNPRLADILEVRSAVVDILSGALRRRGYVHPPVHVLSPCVDPLSHATETPQVKYYGQDCSLMQSMIFHKMVLLAMSDLERVFWISPNVRKEASVRDKARYATEFTQIDFETTTLDMDGCLGLIEEILAELLATLATTHGAIIEKRSGRRLEPLSGPMARLDAEQEAARRGIAVDDVEAVLAAEITQPIFLTNLKREAYDRRDDSSGKYRNYDVVMPRVGEVLSGAEREHEHERLVLRMRELGYPLPYFEPVLRVAEEFGLKPTAGAGFGVERLVRAVLLLEDIAEVYPFPRVPEELLIL